MAQAEQDRGEEFVRLLGQTQRRIFLYVLGLVPRWTDAEEVVQETNLVLWREFHTFTSGTNFAAWACRVAFNQVLAWRKRRQRDRLELSDAFLDAVARDALDREEELEERTHALADCLGQIPPGHRELIRLRYEEGRTVDDIAQVQQRTTEAVYRAISRIRHALYECVTRRLAGEAAR